MSDRRATRSRRRCDRGSIAVEAALVTTLILFPILYGVIQWGSYFWRAQEVDTYAPPIAAGAVAGTFTCQGLKSLVANEVVAVVNGLAPESGLIDLSQVVVSVVEVLPDVGVTVEISIVMDTGGLASLLPLPSGGALLTDFSQKLTDVRVSDVTCR